MSDLTKSADARLANGSYANHVSAKAGVELGACDAVYIDSNGLLQKASTANVFTGLTGAIAFAGLTATSIPSGTVGEVYGNGAEFFYADSALSAPAYYWGSATAGKIGDAKAGSAADLPVAMSVPDGDGAIGTNIVLIRGI